MSASVSGRAAPFARDPVRAFVNVVMRVLAIPSKPLWRRRVAGAVSLEFLSRGETLDWLCVVAFSMAGFALALTHPWSHAYIGEAQYGDAAYWDFAGENWARGYFAIKAPDIRPGYSVFLGVVYALTGASFQHAFVAQALLFAACVGLVYVIARLIRGRLAGVLAAALLALDPYFWEWVATSTTELLGSFANLVAVFFLVRGCRPRANLWNVALFGALLAVANVVRPVTLAFVGPVVVCMLLWHRVVWRRRLAEGAVVLAGLGLGLLPGVLYQYYATGDPGLSSNSAANLFAASSPTYLTWTPAVYDDVTRDLQTRGVVVTQERLNAEFTRLTVQNYLQNPGFQVQRIVDGFRAYGDFEGEATRERFTLYRPWLLALGVVGAMVLSAIGVPLRWRLVLRSAWRWWAVLPGLGLLVGLVSHPARTLMVLQIAGLLLPLLALLVRRRDWRSLGWLMVGLFWLTTGLLAILSTGIAGFFLDRLYTQVEPERALLLALAAVEITIWPISRSRRAGVYQARSWLRRFRVRLPRATRVLAFRAGVVGIMVLGVGLLRLAAVNLQATDSPPLPPPSAAELSAAVHGWGLPGPVVYVGNGDFGPTRALLMSGALPGDSTVYAFPGQSTRFLWYLDDEDRTLFWYVFSVGLRPLALDKNLITAETSGRLPVSSFGNQTGLLFVAPTSAYFDRTGVVLLQNVLTIRAFAPWDALANRFKLEDAQVFPMTTPLYDATHFNAAVHDRSVTDGGPLRLSVDGPLLRTLTFRPFESADPARAAVLTFRNIWVPPGSEFRTSLALHPRLQDHDEVGRTRVEVTVIGRGRSPVKIIQHVLDPSSRADTHFALVTGDLGEFAGQNVDISVRVIANPYSTAAPEVIFGEPRILMR